MSARRKNQALLVFTVIASGAAGFGSVGNLSPDTFQQVVMGAIAAGVWLTAFVATSVSVGMKIRSEQATVAKPTAKLPLRSRYRYRWTTHLPLLVVVALAAQATSGAVKGTWFLSGMCLLLVAVMAALGGLMFGVIRHPPTPCD